MGLLVGSSLKMCGVSAFAVALPTNVLRRNTPSDTMVGSLVKTNVRALIIRIGFGVNCTPAVIRNPENPILIIKAPTVH